MSFVYLSLTGPHLLHPFILRSTLLRDLRDLYSLETSMSNLARFRIYMVFAIGAVSLFRTGQHSIPPISYYASAKEHADEALGFGGLEHIQNLLLLVIFSVHHAVGSECSAAEPPYLGKINKWEH